MSTDGTRMCELLVGLPDVKVLEVVETEVYLRVKIETCGERPLGLHVFLGRGRWSQPASLGR